LTDTEERCRRRYLDTTMSPEVKERFILRSKLVFELRKYLNDSGYLEVETPILQHLPGGANAEPFKTHHNSLDIDLYLRIAPELYLKKLLIGGFPKIFELGRNFRNEGIDTTHNPEFTMLEFYESFSDAKKQMDYVEKMLKNIIQKILGKKLIEYAGSKIDLSKKFQHVNYFDLLKRHALLVEIDSAKKEHIAIKAAQFGIEVNDGDSKEKIMDSIYKKVCRPKLVQPTFVVNYPKNSLPLAKLTKNDPRLVDAFQLVIGGIELVKGFSELSDPIEQAERFNEQEKNRQEGDAEAQRTDSEFIEALEYGMPPAGGVGIGIDRLAMFVADVKNVKEVILFPTMRPRE